MEIVLNLQNFYVEVLKADKPVIVMFYLPACSPCKKMLPIWEEVAQEFSSEYKFGKLNSEEEKNIATKYGIGAVPGFLFVKNGVVIGKTTGHMDKDELISKIQNYFGK